MASGGPGTLADMLARELRVDFRGFVQQALYFFEGDLNRVRRYFDAALQIEAKRQQQALPLEVSE